MNRSSAGSRVGTIAVALSTALVLIALAIVPFLNPAWVAFEQGRTGAAALTGFSEAQLRVVSNAILDDLVAGPPDFDVEIAGQAVLTAPERAHMRDVRGVFANFFAAAAVGAVILGVAFWLASRRGATWTRRKAWRAVRFGAIGLGAAIAVAGVIALVAFDAAFEVFHRLFFAQGTYLFDPRTSRLVQLFPDAFWSETSIAVGATILAFAVAVAWMTGRRLRALAPAPTTGSAAARPGADATPGLTAADPGRAR